ncbi:hypothetical protein [Bernardetia sp. MNP-M8]|uniref:hypothetical protein n=1 Tax=Bernardetia sp. MNP-M8 TaxID=3127470 RepID=UPI0030D39A76
MKTPKEIYKKYFIDNNLERLELFNVVTNEYRTKKALYPGSFVHIAASFSIPEVVYVDTDKQAIRFFREKEVVREIINTRKTYSIEPIFGFIGANYIEPLDLKKESFDLLISQYSGIISRYCKNYLKIGGILLTNNSHADAGVAHLDKDYELIAVMNEENGEIRISDKDLDEYFIPKGKINPTIEGLIESGKGIKYTRIADNYIFKRVK